MADRIAPFEPTRLPFLALSRRLTLRPCLCRIQERSEEMLRYTAEAEQVEETIEASLIPIICHTDFPSISSDYFTQFSKPGQLRGRIYP